MLLMGKKQKLKISLLHHAAGSQILPLQFGAGSQISLLHDAAGVKSMIVAEIFPLHDAARSQIFLLHFAVERCDSLLHPAARGQIFPLHFAAGRESIWPWGVKSKTFSHVKIITYGGPSLS
jgi:hypothetical protein